MADIRETSYVQTAEESTAVITTNEFAQINRIMRLKDKHPDEVEVMYRPEDNYGVLMARIPKKWFRITPSRSTTYTDEQKAALVERLRVKKRPEYGEK